ncbi:hypothetical protein [Conservatibacter flavescens]|nr:hypothetical protein [Conservatibacter flavescens]
MKIYKCITALFTYLFSLAIWASDLTTLTQKAEQGDLDAQTIF